MKIHPIKQPDSSACGPTSIQMTMRYFRIPHSFKEIGKVSGYKKKGGLTNIGLVFALQKLGLKTKTKNTTSWASLKKLNTNKHVIIVSWMMKGYIGHFSVVEKVGDNFIILADPDTGTFIRMQRKIFMRLWMDYDDLWYPVKNIDIQLRWMCIVSKK